MLKDRDNPGVAVCPPAAYFIGVLAGVGLDYLWPMPFLAATPRYILGLVCIVAGLGLAVAAIRVFHRAGTNVAPTRPTLSIVAVGPYRFSRNPIYIGAALVQAGIAALADNLWILLLLVPVLAILRFGVIAREERYLAEKFGASYGDYKSRVRRWI